MARAAPVAPRTGIRARLSATLTPSAALEEASNARWRPSTCSSESLKLASASSIAAGASQASTGAAEAAYVAPKSRSMTSRPSVSETATKGR